VVNVQPVTTASGEPLEDGNELIRKRLSGAAI